MAELHRWTNASGEAWACAAYDHGPLCRLCQSVDETLALLFQAADEGLMEWKQEPDGEFKFRNTQKGQAQVDDLLQTSPEMLDLWLRLHGKEGVDG